MGSIISTHPRPEEPGLEQLLLPGIQRGLEMVHWVREQSGSSVAHTLLPFHSLTQSLTHCLSTAPRIRNNTVPHTC